MLLITIKMENMSYAEALKIVLNNNMEILMI